MLLVLTLAAFPAARLLKAEAVPGMIQSQALNDHQNVPEGSRVESITMNYRVEALDPTIMVGPI